VQSIRFAGRVNPSMKGVVGISPFKSPSDLAALSQNFNNDRLSMMVRVAEQPYFQHSVSNRVSRALRDAGRGDGVDPQFSRALRAPSYRIHVIVVVPENLVDAVVRQEYFVLRERIAAFEVEEFQARRSCGSARSETFPLDNLTNQDRKERLGIRRQHRR
jgi:hypothetical protein